MYRSKLINVRYPLTITFPILHAHRETEANFYHPVEATGQVNISLCICEPGGEERYVHTVRSGTQSSRSHLIVSSCNTIMMAAAELIYLNTLYMFCALTCAGIETLVKTRPKQFKKISKKSASVEFTFTVWTCLYIATLLCVLWQMAFQTQSPDIKYLCSWFSIVQFAFFSTFLLSYVACFNSVSKVICEIFFPTINATAWIVVMVCLSDGQGVAEFRDLRYFTVHILPGVAASFHEIYIFSFCGFSSTATKGQLKTVWTIYSPALLLTSYALSYDQTEVYSYNLSPPNPLFVIFIGIFSNVRYVYFPFQLS